MRFGRSCFLLFFAVLPLSPWAGEPLANEPVTPVPRVWNLDPQRVALGDRLFHDPRLSRDDTVSCASCHVLSKGGADPRAYSKGIGGAMGDINTPTVFNSALNFVQFWNGRAESLEEQVNGPVHNPAEMGSDWNQVLPKLRRDAPLMAQFRSAYGEGPTPDNIRDAIATFERSLNTPDSPFDRYLRGEEQALSVAAKRGYLLFKSYGCASCHQGTAVGGNLYQRMGAMENYFAGRSITNADLGRYTVTHDERDRYVFKVPSLRMAALTAPYFHDGRAADLDEAINLMARYQLGRSIPKAQRADIAAFIASLWGPHPRLQP